MGETKQERENRERIEASVYPTLGFYLFVIVACLFAAIFNPGHDRDAPLALQEMREALQAIFQNPQLYAAMNKENSNG